MSASKVSPLHVLRGILRRVKAQSDMAPSHGDSNVRRFLVDQYRTSRSAPPEKVKELQKLALDYNSLKQDLQERSRLQQLDTGADQQLSPRELSRRAAARAGLQLPKLNPDLD